MNKILLLLLLSFTAHAMETEMQEALQTSKSSKIKLNEQQRKFLQKLLNHERHKTDSEICPGITAMLGSMTGLLTLFLSIPTYLNGRDSAFIGFIATAAVSWSVVAAGCLRLQWLSKRWSGDKDKFIREGMHALGSKANDLSQLLETDVSQLLEWDTYKCYYCQSQKGGCMKGLGALRGRELTERISQRRANCSYCKIRYFRETLGFNPHSETDIKFLTHVLTGIDAKCRDGEAI